MVRHLKVYSLRDVKSNKILDCQSLQEVSTVASGVVQCLMCGEVCVVVRVVVCVSFDVYPVSVCTLGHYVIVVLSAC